MARLAAVATLQLVTAALLLAPLTLATSRHHARSTPRAHASTCRRSKHVVYTSFERPELYMHVASHYTARALAGKATVHHLNIVNTATEYGDAEHMAKTNAPNVDRQGLVQRHDINMTTVTGYTDLATHYLHSSVNGRDYELLCMARFLALRDFCMDEGIDVLSHLDGDIALFDNSFLDNACIPANHTSWYYSHGSTYMFTVSCREVGAFADFLLRFYVRANRTAIIEDVVQHGDTVDVQSRAAIEAQVPEYASAKIAPRHISDMYLLAAFFKAQDVGANIIRPYIYRDHHAHADTLVSLGNLRFLFPEQMRASLCVNNAIFDAHVRLSETEQQYFANGTWNTLPGAHFQGSDCKAHLVRTLGGAVVG